MFNPISTYRIQFHKDFTFADLEKLIPYLQNLGISTVYASPIFSAVPGSVHGYDAVHPIAINPEIGTIEELYSLSGKLKEAGLGWVQDIVPNHAAYHTANVWLMDVLEKGEQSIYSSFFDTAWSSDLFTGKLMVPFLGASLEDVINNNELKLGYEDGRLCLNYYSSCYPLKAGSYATVLKLAKENDAIDSLLKQTDDLHKTEEVEKFGKGWDELLLQLGSLMQNEVVKISVEGAIETINNDKTLLSQLAGEQHYRLCHWQETDSRINYRRFFTVNGLICLNIQDEAVFTGHHSLIKQLVDDKVFQGLRVDHIDGLYNPTEYQQRLRKLAGDETYIVVEKILEQNEELPSWPVQGTTGYDFLATVNNLFTSRKSEAAFTDFYENLTGNYQSIPQQLHEKKSLILYEHMGGELENLYRYFLQLNIADKKYLARIPAEDMKSAIGEFLIQCPVYRFYGSNFPLRGDEEKSVQAIVQRLRKSSESKEAVAVLEHVLLHKPHEGDVEVNGRIAKLYQRLMQFSGPLMAKGMEDTLMYTFNRFIGHNEVGDSPESFGISVSRFHQAMRERQQQWPLAMNATATHDTKRGEDARARLNVLTDLGQSWLDKVSEWMEMNAELKGESGPDANDEYLIYQALVGHYSAPPPPKGGVANAQPSPIGESVQKIESLQSRPRSEALDNPPLGGGGAADFAQRIQTYLEKALREAKTHSNWTSPNKEYESATKAFAVALLDKSKPFWKSFQSFLQSIREHAAINSLSQVLLKATLPGMPDTYQGCEVWDYSFVDPDNRRAVDYEKQQAVLKRFETIDNKKLLPRLWKEDDGGIKLWLTQQLLTIRKSDANLFAEGDYLPLQTEGKYKEHVFAFARKQGEKTYLFAIPLHTAALCGDDSFFRIDWADTRIVLPKEFTGFSDMLSGRSIGKSDGLFAKNLFKKFTASILKGKQTAKDRGAGILLHITSLPSAFGVGDLGPAARTFADFLHRSGQKYWQLLPLNPTEEGQGWSPYSALSSKAGWPLLISPELLVREGWLKSEELDAYRIAATDKVDYAAAQKSKEEILDKAFDVFNVSDDSSQQSFELFCEKEKAWLNDFAVFMLLKEEHNHQPWYEWPDELKQRDSEALQDAEAKNEKAIRKIKWLQFVFTKQWKELKAYCNNRNIRFIGDMPFYVSYDSADVWAAQEYFSLDENGQRTGMAGVPPDAFSADGQLWGMPTFKWEVMTADGYRWWMQRLRKNIELFDLTRLDHFRAFEAYWQVPAGETTARNGRWLKGPGLPFFKAVQKEFGEAPFIAEDLGDINEDVLNLRDEAHLPGMKVLQFAFGSDMPQSGYIPHNYEKEFLVYSGTHDNNTTVGWWRTEADESVKTRARDYMGSDVDEDNVHEVFSRLAYASVADTAIVPMQDVLGLNESARMNVPSSATDNWSWRLTEEQLKTVDAEALNNLMRLYNRD